MKVAIVVGQRSTPPMGLELAEVRLLEALKADPQGIDLDVRVVGRRRALLHARSIGARWIPAGHGRMPRRASVGSDLVHLLGLDLPPPPRTPFVATIHDLSSVHFDDEVSLPPWIDEIVSRARYLLTPSAFTASEIQRHFGVAAERIRTFGGASALDSNNAEPLSEAELAQLGITPPFALRYGGYTARKNVPLLLDAWGRVDNGTLVLAGPPQAARERLLSHARSLKGVVVLDYVPNHVLARLLRTASVVVSTSSYEGFGLPPLEALAAGVAVVAVSEPFVREICGDAAILVNSDASELAEAISAVLKTESQPGESAARRTSVAHRTWRLAACKVLESYEFAAATA